jgi:hypothetical protein
MREDLLEPCNFLLDVVLYVGRTPHHRSVCRGEVFAEVHEAVQRRLPNENGVPEGPLFLHLLGLRSLVVFHDVLCRGASFSAADTRIYFRPFVQIACFIAAFPRM